MHSRGKPLQPVFNTGLHLCYRNFVNTLLAKDLLCCFGYIEQEKISKLTMVSTNCGLTSFKRRTIWNISTACSAFSWSKAFMHAMKVPERFPPSLNKDSQEFLNVAKHRKVQRIKKFQFFDFTKDIYLHNFYR